MYGTHTLLSSVTTYGQPGQPIFLHVPLIPYMAHGPPLSNTQKFQVVAVEEDPHKLKLPSESHASGLSNGETGGDARKSRLLSAASVVLSCPHGSHTFGLRTRRGGSPYTGMQAASDAWHTARGPHAWIAHTLRRLSAAPLTHKPPTATTHQTVPVWPRSSCKQTVCNAPCNALRNALCNAPCNALCGRAAPAGRHRRAAATASA